MDASTARRGRGGNRQTLRSARSAGTINGPLGGNLTLTPTEVRWDYRQFATDEAQFITKSTAHKLTRQQLLRLSCCSKHAFSLSLCLSLLSTLCRRAVPQLTFLILTSPPRGVRSIVYVCLCAARISRQEALQMQRDGATPFVSRNNKSDLQAHSKTIDRPYIISY